MSFGNIFALDLGTTKFCIAGLSYDNNEQPHFDAVSVPAAGMKRGMVCDFAAAKAGILQLLDLAEQHFDTEITKVVVGVAGNVLHCWKSPVSTPISGQEITPSSLKKLSTLARSTAKRAEREVLHTVPLHYRVDGREPVRNPVGFSGHSLSADFFHIDADASYLRDIIQLCNQSGLEVVRLYSEAFSSASVTVDDQLKDLGVVVCDIGGGTTDGLLFQNGFPAASFSVNVAGSLMTNDLAIGLNLSVEEAERVKCYFGLRKDRDLKLEVQDVLKKTKIVTAKEVYPILACRIFELAQLIVEQLKPYKGKIGGGVLLTGGGSEVQELAPFFAELLRVPVKKSSPHMHLPASTPDQPHKKHLQTFETKLATAFGLINLEVGHKQFEQSLKRSVWSNQYLNQFLNWLKELS